MATPTKTQILAYLKQREETLWSRIETAKRLQFEDETIARLEAEWAGIFDALCFSTQKYEGR